MVDIDDGSNVAPALKLSVNGNYEGEMSIEELEEVDEVVKSDNEPLKRQRIGVSTTEMEKGIVIDYAVQESMHAWTLNNIEERLEAFTEIDEPFVTVDEIAVRFGD